MSLPVCVLCRTSGPCVPPPVCPCWHQAVPSGIGPFLERSINILRRPSALSADGPATPVVSRQGLRRVLWATRLGLEKGELDLPDIAITITNSV